MRPPVKRMEIAGILRREICSGQYANCNRLPVEPELALRLGVTRKTLRSALDLLEKEGIVDRIPGKGTFPVRRNAEENRNIFLLLPCSDYFLKSDYQTRTIIREILSGCLQEACLRKAHVITLPLTTDNKIENFDQTILDRLPDGSRIVFYSNWYAPIFPLFLRRKFRIAHIHHLTYQQSELKRYVDQWISCKADVASGVRKLVARFAEQGYRRIALATSFLENEFNPSKSGYLQGLGELAQESLPLMCDIGGISESPMLFVERLRRFYEETRFDALIFGLHDSLVLNFAQSLNRNLGLPEDVAIATLFPYDYNNKFMSPVPCMSFQYESIGIFAVQSLFQEQYKPQEIVFSPRIGLPE